MTTIINGSSPSVTFSDSTTQTTAFTTTPVINTINSQAATPLTFGINGTEAMRIDSSGNVSIGTTSPSAPLQVKVGTNNNFKVKLQGGTTLNLSAENDASSAQVAMQFNSGAMTLDSSGNLLVGGTAQRNLAKQSIEYTSGNNGLAIYCVANANATDFVTFTANAGTVCGTISRVGTTSAVVYTATSDYRLKENIQPFVNALDSVSKLKPCNYTWKDGGASANGFIAHELQKICPDAVVGEKDAVDENGNPKYQAIDQSKIVALLTAAIQEQQALIENLTTRLTALENK